MIFIYDFPKMEQSRPISNSPILEAQADFSMNLLREVSTGGKSTIVSPISVAIALSMVYAGANDQTSEELGQLLAKGAPKSRVHEYFGNLIRTIQNGQKNYTLEVANKVYVKSGFTVFDTFKQTIDRQYGGLFEQVNFTQSEATAKIINEFVEQATHDKIHDLIKPEMLNAMITRLVLINAVYFKGNWADKFDPMLTEKKPFYISEGNQKEVDMLCKTGDFIYFENDELQLLGIPYSGEDVHMFVLLPKERFGLDKLLTNLNGKALLQLVQNRRKMEVDVILPKFMLESTHELNEPLKKLGMATAFSRDANFQGISTAEQLQISQIIQKAFIEINEQGTEAAAATAILMEAESDDESPPPPEFHADRPFAFVLISVDGGETEARTLFAGIFRETD